MEVDHEYFNQKLAEMPKDFLEGSVNFLKGYLPENVKQSIIEVYEEFGLIDWIGNNHHGWGTGIRNALRDAGFLDDQLPNENWDDYYIQVVELAVGIRE